MKKITTVALSILTLAACGELKREKYLCEGNNSWLEQELEINWQVKTLNICNDTGCYDKTDAVFTEKTVAFDFGYGDNPGEPLHIFDGSKLTLSSKALGQVRPAKYSNCSAF